MLHCCLLVRVQPLSLAWVDLHHTDSLWALFQGPIVKFRLGYLIFYLGISKSPPPPPTLSNTSFLLFSSCIPPEQYLIPELQFIIHSYHDMYLKKFSLLKFNHQFIIWLEKQLCQDIQCLFFHIGSLLQCRINGTKHSCLDSRLGYKICKLI